MRARRVDDNQASIVKALRKVGATVQPIHQIGGGCPDLLVGFRYENYLLELKDGAKPPSARKLTPDEEGWHKAWFGRVRVVASPQEALEAIGA